MDIPIQSGRVPGICAASETRRNAAAILFFLAANTLKITLFDVSIISSDTLQVFLYKLAYTFMLTTVLLAVLLGTRSRVLFVAFYILQDIYIFINIIYYGYFHSYLHLSQVFALFSEGLDVARCVPILLSLRCLLAVLDIPFFIYVLMVFSGLLSAALKVKLRYKASLVLACLLVIAGVEADNYAHSYSIIDMVKPNSISSEGLVVQRYGTMANSLADMVLDKNDSSMISQFKYGQQLTSGGKPGARPNFAVIQVESMDANAVNKQHDGQYVMPFLHSLAQQNVYYPYTLSYHEAGGTSDAEFSTMNSIEPLESYPSIDLDSYTYPNSIVRKLANESYSTLAFHGNVASYFNRDIAYPKMGYQGFEDMVKMGLPSIGWGASDGEVFGYAEKLLSKQKQPFFAYTITMSSHAPFTSPDSYYVNHLFDDVTDTTSREYMNSLSYVDQALKDYVDYIRSNLKNTYIIIWGDHTPNVESSFYTQASCTQGDKYFEFVPLIIVTPDGKQHIEDKIAASFLDVAPTIANASGIPYTLDSDGIDLLNPPDKAEEIPYRGGIFDRSQLFSEASLTSGK